MKSTPATIAARALMLAPPLIIAIAYARTLAPGITWANDGADSGDLVAAAATLGVAHPTGYPTYLLLARLFLALPFGDLAWRAALLSALGGILAALFAGMAARELIPDARDWPPRLAAAFATLLMGIAPVLWSQSVIPEVYSVSAAFLALALWLSARAQRDDAAEPAWLRRGGALLVGLSVGVHITAGLMVALWFVACAAADLRRGDRARVGERALWAGAGLLVYLYLPIRAAAHPPINWGDPRDLAGFWWVVSGQLYRPLAFGLPLNEVGGRVAAAATLLREQFGVAGMLLAVFGLLYGRARSQLFLGLSVVAALLYAVFAIFYNTKDSYPYLIPSFLIVAIWLGLGLAAALRWLGRWPAAPVLASLALLAWAGWHAFITLPKVDASGDRRAIVFAERVMAAAPPGALVLTNEDRDAFPVWYAHYALRQRPDLVVMVDPLLDFVWYRANLRAVYPTLVLAENPAADATWASALTRDNPGLPICRTDADGPVALQCEP